MAKHAAVLQLELAGAKKLAATIRNNLRDASPELVGYWDRQLQDAQADVARLSRELDDLVSTA